MEWLKDEWNAALLNEMANGLSATVVVVALAVVGENAFTLASACKPTGLSAMSLEGWCILLCVWSGLWIVRALSLVLCSNARATRRPTITPAFRVASVCLTALIALPITTALPNWTCDLARRIKVVLWVWIAMVWCAIPRCIFFYFSKKK